LTKMNLHGLIQHTQLILAPFWRSSQCYATNLLAHSHQLMLEGERSS
jgi:hypothetical protein